ncbi:META domain-containing protein [Treponema sp. OttesenSCG-928-L16]|nr:META domain-containing protein [Treponema sp. OttesenSCG-928-L16]
MRNVVTLFVLACAFGGVFFSCAGNPEDRKSVSISDLEGRVWQLMEVRDPANPIKLDWTTISQDGMKDFYTLEFLNDGRIAGVGSPNRYFGPYEQGEGNAISFGNVASTLMANIFDPFNLKEHQYFAYLGGVKSWGSDKDGNLELYTQNPQGAVTILVYSAVK